MPLALRFTLNHSVGRPFVEERTYQVLRTLRAYALSPGAGTSDLRQLVLDQAPQIASAIESGVESTTSGIKSLVAAPLGNLGGGLAAAWWGKAPAAPAAPAAPQQQPELALTRLLASR